MCGEKLLVSSLLQDLAARQHDDVICVLDGGEAVCHDEQFAAGSVVLTTLLSIVFLPLCALIITMF